LSNYLHHYLSVLSALEPCHGVTEKIFDQAILHVKRGQELMQARLRQLLPLHTDATQMPKSIVVPHSLFLGCSLRPAPPLLDHTRALLFNQAARLSRRRWLRGDTALGHV
jgi:hypothetical protein